MSYAGRPAIVLKNPTERQNRVARAIITLAVIIIVIIILILVVRAIINPNTNPRSPNCASDADCPAAVPRCNLATRQCAICLADSDCSEGRACTNNVCVKDSCRLDSDCPSETPFCDLSKGNCSECLRADQCPVAGSACNSNGLCVRPCTDPPDPVTALAVSSTGKQQTIQWVPPNFNDTNGVYNGKAIRNYLVSREIGACSANPGNIADLKVIPYGTNQAVFSELADARNCYRVVSQNDCGETALANAPRITGSICDNRPFPLSKGATPLTATNQCSDNMGQADACGIQDINSTVSCRAQMEWIALTGPGLAGGLIITRTNAIWEHVTNVVDPFTQQYVRNKYALLDGEATLGFPFDKQLFYSRTGQSWYVKCATAAQTNVYRVAKWIVARNDISVTLPANPTVTWNAVPGADEYVVTMDVNSLRDGGPSIQRTSTFGINIAVSDLVDPLNPSYTFVGIPVSETYWIGVFGYQSCDKSNPTPLNTIFY